MATIPGQVVIDKIVPTDTLDTYPTHSATYGLGGHRTVADIITRDAIPSERREQGMTVWVISEDKEYILKDGVTNSDWYDNTSSGGGGSGADPIPAPTFVPVFQTFSKGAGYATTYQITNISNGSLAIALDAANIQTTKPVEIVFASTGKPVYDNLFPRTQSHRITATVDSSGLVTLSAAPYSGYTADIEIHFYYKLTVSNSITNYFYNDVLVTPEATLDTFASDVQVTDAGSKLTATNVEAALSELIDYGIIQEIIIVQKNPVYGQFSTIEAALASITDNSISKPYLIKIGPGVYTENALTMKPYVYLEGSGEQLTIIQPVTNTSTIITGVANSKISHLQLTGASGSGGKAVSCSNFGSVFPFLMETVVFGNNETHVSVSTTVAITIAKLTKCTTGGTFNFTTGFLATSSNASQPAVLILDSFSFLDIVAPFPSILFQAVGTGAQLAISNTVARTGSGGTAIYVEDGAEARVLGSTFRGFQYGIHATATGAGPVIRSTGVNYENSTYDVFVENPSTTGYLTGFIDYLKQNININSQFFISDKPTQTIKVAKKGGDYTSISAAAAGISDAGSDKPYLILVGAGEFTEPQINLPSYVSVAGLAIQASIIIPDGNHHVFNLGTSCEVSFLTIRGINASGKAAIYVNDIGDFAQIHKVSIYDCDIGVQVEALTQDTNCYAEYIDVNNAFTNAIKIHSPNSFIANCVAENFYTFPSSGNTGPQILVDGDQSNFTISAASLQGGGLDKGIYITNNANIESKATGYIGFTTAIDVDTSSTSDLIISGVIFKDNSVLDINIASPTASGSLFGHSDYLKTFINIDSTFFIINKYLQIITVGKRGSDFFSVADAVNNITDSSVSKPYLVKIGPGIYSEPIIDLSGKPYVSVEGASITTTIIEPDANNHHIFELDIFNDISNLTVRNAGSGFAAFSMADKGATHAEYSRIHRVEIQDCDIGVNIYSSIVSVDTSLNLEFITFLGTYTNAIKIQNDGSICACSDAVHITLIPTASTAPTHVYVTGANAQVMLHACMLHGTGLDTGFLLENGSKSDISATIIDNADIAISIPNVGTASSLNSSGITINNSNTYDFNIQHPTAMVTVTGTLDNSKVSNASSNFSFNYLDSSTGEIELSNQINMTFDTNVHTDISTLLVESSTMGVMEGGELSDGGGFVVDIADGFGYYEEEPEILHKKTWTSTSITLSANVDKYIYFDSSGTLTSSSSIPNSFYNIILGRVVTNSSAIEFIDRASINAEHTSNTYATVLRKGLGAIYESGSSVTENVTPLHIDISGGSYYFGTTAFAPTGATNATFREYFRDGSGGWTISDQTALKIKKDDNSGTLQNLTTSYYIKHSLFVVGDGAGEKYFVVIGQTEYSTLLTAQEADIPVIPDYFSDSVCLIANIILQQGFSNIVEVQDARPRIGFKAFGTSSSSDHQSLSNRDNPAAHAQYLLRDGTSAMTANLDLGGFTIVNNAALPGTTTAAPVTQNADQSNTEGASIHKARADHVHNIPTGVPISVGTSNTQGSASTFAKSDHQHSHGNQTVDTHHAVVVAGTSHGFMSKTDKTKLDAIGGSKVFKQGLAVGTSFSGTPKKLTITFSAAFANTNYTINITGAASRFWTYESKTINGFVINANADTAFTEELVWSCISTGESVE